MDKVVADTIPVTNAHIRYVHTFSPALSADELGMTSTIITPLRLFGPVLILWQIYSEKSYNKTWFTKFVQLSTLFQDCHLLERSVSSLCFLKLVHRCPG